MAITHKIPSIGSFTEVKCKHQVRVQIEDYLEKLRQVATKKGLELNRKNMQNYMGGLFQNRTMLLFLKKEGKIGSKSSYLNSMEARVYFQPNTIMHFWMSHSTKLSIDM